MVADKCAPHVKARIASVLSAASVADRSPIVRAAAVKSLATFSDSSIKDTLVRCTNDSSVFVRIEAVRGLSNRLDAKTIPEIGRLAKSDPEVETRRAAVEALGKAADAKSKEAALAQLAPCVADHDFTVSRAAIHILEARTGKTFGAKYEEWAAYLHLPPTKTQPGKPTAPMLGN
jgi:HEAT repeat protein